VLGAATEEDVQDTEKDSKYCADSHSDVKWREIAVFTP